MIDKETAWKIFLAGATIYKLGEFNVFTGYHPNNLKSPHTFIDGLAYPLSIKFEELYETDKLIDFSLVDFDSPLESITLEEVTYHWRFNRKSNNLWHEWEIKQIEQLPKQYNDDKVSAILKEARRRFPLYKKGLKIENLTEEGYKYE